MAQLAGDHDDLTAMMTFVRDEVREDVGYVERKITPGVRPRNRDRATVLKTEF